MGNDYIENDLLSPTIEEIRDARPFAMVLPKDVLNRAALQRPYVRVDKVVATHRDLRSQAPKNSIARFETIFSYSDSDLTSGQFLQSREGIRVFPHEENQSSCLRVRFRTPLFPLF
jgi:hypothetical protein